jgi:hypothetical protein
MNILPATRTLSILLGAAALSLTLVGEAPARNLSFSAGGGVKCYYVLVSSVNGVNTWKTVCRKGP